MTCSIDNVIHLTCIHTHMCHEAGAKVGWIKECCGLTFTM